MSTTLCLYYSFFWMNTAIIKSGQLPSGTAVSMTSIIWRENMSATDVTAVSLTSAFQAVSLSTKLTTHVTNITTNGPAKVDSTRPEERALIKSAHAFPEESNMTTATSNAIGTTRESEKIGLNLTFISPTKGYIKSPVWSRVTALAGNRVDDTVHVTVPGGHGLFVSWWIRLKGNCSHLTLQLYIGEEDYQGGQPHWTYCNEEPPKPELLHTEAFRVHVFFFSPKNKWGTFQMLFTFHKDSALPQKLSASTWNCSVTHWPEFQQHLSCNLKRECAGGEDEAGCDYQSHKCGPGLILAAGGCYKYIDVHKPGSWHQARAVCRKEGGYLVSLNTPEEWDAVIRLLQRVNVFRVFTGLIFQNPFRSLIYRTVPTWLDETVMHFGSAVRGSLNLKAACSSFDFSRYEERLLGTSCDLPLHADILCEMKNTFSTSRVALPRVIGGFRKTSMIECPLGHETHIALACDVHSACWGHGFGLAYTCDAPLTPTVPSFACNNLIEFVPYSLVCDYRRDCRDGSDEDFCIFPPCDVDPFPCGNKQCVEYRRECNLLQDCTNEADEHMCPVKPVMEYKRLQLPYRVRKKRTRNIMAPYQGRCLQSYFTCRTIQICLPLYLRCNGISDCPGHEDELGCDTCPGFYRCRGSSVCLQPFYVCDELSDCPEHDDERFCKLPCPENCTCYALSAYCHHRFSARMISDLRFLEARDSGMTLTDLANTALLVHLGLGNCGLRHLNHLSLPNVLYLDASDNLLTTITLKTLHQFPNLQKFLLDGNPMRSIFLRSESDGNHSFPSIVSLGLSRSFINEIDVGIFTVFTNLKMLNLSGSGIGRVSGQSLGFLKELTVLDLRKCPLTDIPPRLLRNLYKIETVFADNYKLCCPAMLPKGFNLANCHAPSDEISSCDALLMSNAYRVMLSVFAVLTLIGNLGSFTYRVFINISRGGFGVFVTHLSVSDLLMGVYLTIIGVADRVYLGNYLWADITWKNSTVCSMAGYLSFVSSEVSAFIICLITVDRVLVLRFPFSQVRFHQRSAHVASGVAWTLGIVLAAVPLVPRTSRWQFYSQNGICFPLPIAQRHFPGQSYSFGVFVIFNFVLFLFIAVGQLSIYHTVRTNSMMDAETTKSSKDLAIARRLITIAMTDFLSWFPIGVLGLLASSGTPISGKVNVAIAVLALPLNSALNPFLYTFNLIVERRRKEREKRLHSIIMAAEQTKGNAVALDEQ